MLIPPLGGGHGSPSAGLLDDICEIYRLPGKRHLLGWMVGKDLCARVCEASGEELCTALWELMARYSSDPAKVPQASSVIKTSWGTDPHYLGSYSCLPVGSGAVPSPLSTCSRNPLCLSSALIPHIRVPQCTCVYQPRQTTCWSKGRTFKMHCMSTRIFVSQNDGTFLLLKVAPGSLRWAGR